MTNSEASKIETARTFLFVPGDRPHRFDKAINSGTDIVIVDLEDAVAPAAKVAARDALLSWLSPERPVLVRVNAVDTPWHADDVDLCARPGVLGMMVPKAEAGNALAEIAKRTPVVALVETARGVAHVNEIATTPGILRLAFGTIDLALDLGIANCERILDPIGLQLVIASSLAGIPSPIAGVTIQLDDPDALKAAMHHSSECGFGAKLCIHPAQIAPVHAALRPTEAECAWASQIISSSNGADGAAVALEGNMVDRPLVERALRIQHRAGRD